MGRKFRLLPAYLLAATWDGEKSFKLSFSNLA
jgi:hypothetical protein